MREYEVTFLHPDGDWTWINVQVRDFHQAMLKGLLECPDNCRVISVRWMRDVRLPEAQS